MTLLTDVTAAAANRLPKVIGPKAHGVIDYAQSAFFLTVGLLCWKRNRPAAIAALGTSALVLTQALLTDYPLGVKPVISFETHGKIDAYFASTSWAIPKLFGFRGTPAAKVFEANSVVAGGIVGMTDFNSSRAFQDRLAG